MHQVAHAIKAADRAWPVEGFPDVVAQRIVSATHHSLRIHRPHQARKAVVLELLKRGARGDARAGHNLFLRQPAQVIIGRTDGGAVGIGDENRVVLVVVTRLKPAQVRGRRTARPDGATSDLEQRAVGQSRDDQSVQLIVGGSSDVGIAIDPGDPPGIVVPDIAGDDGGRDRTMARAVGGQSPDLTRQAMASVALE